MSTRVIIDTDPGVDDAMAIGLALGSPNIIVEGITVVHGNSTDVEKLGRNTCAILEYARKTDIPVHIGSHCALTREDNTGAEFVHGNDCLGDIEFPTPKKTPHPHHSAIQFIVSLLLLGSEFDLIGYISKVIEFPQQIVLIALGPLTIYDIALALKLYPDLPKYVKDIVIMGGSVFVPGNMNPVAEANIYCDPEAARIVFQTKWPHKVYVAALDITEKIRVTPKYFEELSTINAFGKFIFDIFKFFQKFHVDVVGTEDFPVHDATAVMAVVRPDLFTANRLVYVDVETKGELTRGMLVPYPIGGPIRTSKEPNIILLDGVDVEEYLSVYRAAIKNLS